MPHTHICSHATKSHIQHS